MDLKKPMIIPYAGCEGNWVEAKSYPSSSQTFGYFWCGRCQKTWMSAYSRKGYKQGCKICESYFYPAYLWVNDHKKTDHHGERAL